MSLRYVDRIFAPTNGVSTDKLANHRGGICFTLIYQQSLKEYQEKVKSSEPLLTIDQIPDSARRIAHKGA